MGAFRDWKRTSKRNRGKLRCLEVNGGRYEITMIDQLVDLRDGPTQSIGLTIPADSIVESIAFCVVEAITGLTCDTFDIGTPTTPDTYFADEALTAATDGIKLVNSATTSAITLQVTTELAEAIDLANELKTDYTAHIADDSVHNSADGTNTISSDDATTLATAITLANEIKSDYTAHIANDTVHNSADSTNTVAASDATTLATLKTLLNEIKTDYTAHIAEDSVHNSADTTNTVSSPDVGTTPTKGKVRIHAIYRKQYAPSS